MTAPAFTEDAIRAMTTEETLSRGKVYALNGAVAGLVRRGNVMTAQVEGSAFAPYEVTIELYDGGVAGTRCSCPYEWGGVCKHVVAVLLKYLDAPDAIAERPSLDDLVHGLDREALAALLIKRAERDPGLALWLEAELAVGRPDRSAAAGAPNRCRSGADQAAG